MITEQTPHDSDRLKYLNKGQLREEIVYAVGGDPSRYGANSDRGISIADARRIATTLQPDDSELDLDAMTIGDLYEHICDWAGGEYSPNAGNPWGINRPNLKEIHRAVDGQPPREVVADGGDAVIEMCSEQVEDILTRLDFVSWDRFTVGHDGSGHGAFVKVYGWIEREEDAYKDFILVTFFPETEENIMGFTTSSDTWTKEIHRRMFETEPDDHNDCQRVEHTFDVPNALTLYEDQSLTAYTDGGDQR